MNVPYILLLISYCPQGYKYFWFVTVDVVWFVVVVVVTHSHVSSSSPPNPPVCTQPVRSGRVYVICVAVVLVKLRVVDDVVLVVVG